MRILMHLKNIQHIFLIFHYMVITTVIISLLPCRPLTCFFQCEPLVFKNVCAILLLVLVPCFKLGFLSRALFSSGIKTQFCVRRDNRQLLYSYELRNDFINSSILFCYLQSCSYSFIHCLGCISSYKIT